MSLSSFLTKLEQKVSGTSSSSSNQQPQQYPQVNPHYNAHPPFQPYSHPNANAFQGPAYNQNPFPNSNPPAPSNYYNQPAYNPPQYAPSPSYAPPPPQQQQQQRQKPATKSFLLSYSSSGTSTIAKDPDTNQQLYIVTYPKYDSWSGKPKSGLDQELHAGDKTGPIIGGWKNSETTKKPSICIGEPKNGAQFQKLKSSSIGGKMGFVSQHNGREYEWRKGDEKFAFRLIDVESGEEVATFNPHKSSLSMSKLGTLEMQLLGGEDWIAAVLMTIIILAGDKVDEAIGKEVLKAVLGA